MQSAGVRNLSGAPARSTPTGMNAGVANSMASAGIANLSGRGLGARPLSGYDPLTSTALVSSGAYDWTQAGRDFGGRSVDTYRAVGSPFGFEADATKRAGTFSLDGAFSGRTGVKSVVDAGKGWTTVELYNGGVEKRSGIRSSRNNNPGNIEYGRFAKKHGAVGSDGRFAVFETPEQGRNAMEALVFGPNYADRTIQSAINRYAPPFENNSKVYASTIAKDAGVSTSTKIKDLTDEQKGRLIDSMIRVEGADSHTVTTLKEGQQIGSAGDRAFTGKLDIAVIDDGEKLNEIDRPGSGIRQKPIHIVDPNGPLTETQTAAVATFENKYLEPLEPAQEVARREVTPYQSPETPEAEGEPAPPERGLGAKIAAGAIDVGVGMLPGVGVPATVVNLGASLTGHRTIGERVVDAVRTADWEPGSPRYDDYNRESRDDGGGSQGHGYPPWYPYPPPQPANPADPVEDFESKYLPFDDGIDRPTPYEKWGRRHRGEI